MWLELAAQSVRMSILQMALHLLFFFLPALALALFCVGCGTWLFRPGAGLPWTRRWAWNAAAGALVLVAGLLAFDNDGKVATYAALVMVSATLEWLLQKGWRAR